MTPFWSVEPILQYLRIRKVLPYMEYGGIHLDIGCDLPPVLINKVKGKMKRCIGIDVVANPGIVDNVQIMSMNIIKKIDLPSSSVNIITLLAVLEHLKYPEEILTECYRILKPTGKLLLTVPSPRNKPVLELFARLQLVRPEMIHQHENYFTQKRLKDMAEKVGFKDIVVQSFELGLNTFMSGRKTN